MGLTASDRAKLVGVLGMLGSEHVGERASAALLASRMVRDRGITWSDLIGQPETSRRREDVPADWRADIDLVRRHPQFCTEWEREFAHSIAHRPRISPKQLAVLTRIATAIRAGGKS